VTVFGLLIVAPAQAQVPATVRLAAGPDCLTNPGCGPGLKRFYKVDVSSVFVPLQVAGTGIAALDAGDAEVAVAFSSDPEVSRPDIKALRDDKGMIGLDPIVPVMRAKLLRDYGAAGARLIRRRLNAISAVLTTRALRQLNQERGISIIYITHDLATAYQVADSIIVLYRAAVAEAGDVELVVKAPKHPYTQLLIASIPQVSTERTWLADEAAKPQDQPGDGGCRFVARCPHAMPLCRRSVPSLLRTEPRRDVACHLYTGGVQQETLAGVSADR